MKKEDSRGLITLFFGEDMDCEDMVKLPLGR